ncbi:MAG: hemerythrin domain-containing protein [Acidobacteriota bacterium]|nr:hemerythrin domain-containing protein [Acidobacteriota bacterium]
MNDETADTLAAALEREHHEIDAGIERFLIAQRAGEPQAEPLRQAIGALRRHIYLEEEFLFPPLSEAGLAVPIFVMLREHGEIWDTMDRAEEQLAQGSGGDPDTGLCLELLAQLERHNSKEEAIVYPRADAALDLDTAAELRSFVATGQMPAGWSCEQARRLT